MSTFIITLFISLEDRERLWKDSIVSPHDFCPVSFKNQYNPQTTLTADATLNSPHFRQTTSHAADEIWREQIPQKRSVLARWRSARRYDSWEEAQQDEATTESNLSTVQPATEGVKCFSAIGKNSLQMSPSGAMKIGAGIIRHNRAELNGKPTNNITIENKFKDTLFQIVCVPEYYRNCIENDIVIIVQRFQCNTISWASSDSIQALFHKTGRPYVATWSRTKVMERLSIRHVALFKTHTQAYQRTGIDSSFTGDERKSLFNEIKAAKRI